MFYFNRFVLPVIALAALILGLAACGGGSTGVFEETLQPVDNSFVGVVNGDFKAVRYNDAGYRDATLNPTFDFTTRTTGNQTTVTIAVSDSTPMVGVALDLQYDASRFNPVSADFAGLVDDPIELFATSAPGVVGLAQADLDGGSMRSGEFVTITFDNSPATVKASSAVHAALTNTAYSPTQLTTGLDGFMVVANGADWDFTQYSVFAAGDGDDNGETNAADISALVVQGNFLNTVSDTNFGPAATDYDLNGEVNPADITPIAVAYLATVDNVELMIDDVDTMAGATVHSTMAFSAGTASNRSPAPFAATTWDPVWRSWTGTVTAAEIAAADTNADGTVFVATRSGDGTAMGTVFSPGLPITGMVATNVTLTGFDVQIIGGTGGGGATDEDFLDGETAGVVANSDLTLNVTGVSGDYDPGTGAIAFTPADAGTLIPQADYDTALADAQGFARWTFSNAGHGEMRMTTDVVSPTTAAGTAQTVTVFPDDDPESDNTLPEGTLLVSMDAAGGAFTAGAGTVGVGIDVTADPDVTTYTFVDSSGGMDAGNHILGSVVGSDITLQGLTYGNITPADLNATTFQLFDFDDPAGHMDFTYTTSNPPAVGQFTIDVDLLIAKAGPAPFQGHFWGARFFAAANKPSSINLLGEWFTTGPTPPTSLLLTAPLENNIGTGDGFLQIFYEDPLMRRDGRVNFNDLAMTITEADAAGYADVIKNNGNEFVSLGFGTGGARMPRATVSTDPLINISASTPSLNGIDMVGAVGGWNGRGPGYCVIDIASLTGGGGPGDPTVNYNFKVYDAGDNEVGYGSFAVSPIGISATTPTGVDWALNIYDDAGRGDAVAGGEIWTDHNLDANTLKTTTPDVLFMEFQDGTISDWPPSATDANMKVVFEEFDHTGNTYAVPLQIRVAGFGGVGISLLAVHPFTADDFVNPIIPGPGILNPGNSYHIGLDDPNFAAAPDFEFLTTMVVTGTNPNLP